MKQKVILIILVIIVIVGGLYWFMNRNKVAAPENNVNTNQSNSEIIGELPKDNPDNNPTVPTSDTIAVSTQVAGNSITVDNAYLEKAGFITIHSVDSKGKAGEIIGTSGLLSVGAKQDLEINVPVKAGEKYIAMLRVDDGDKKFDANKDISVTKGGINVMTMFSVSQ